MLIPAYFSRHSSRKPGIPRASSVLDPEYQNQEDKKSLLTFDTNYCRSRIPWAASVTNSILKTICQLQKGEKKIASVF